jgi:tetratricopeptide (TPR) repeat protein
MRAVVAVTLLVVFQCGLIARQAPAPGPYETYRAAVAAYAKDGDITSAVVPLEKWSGKEFDAAIKATIANKNAAELRAAAVFHLEIGVALAGLSNNVARGHFEFGSDLLARWTASRPLFNAAAGQEEIIFRANWYGVAGSALLAVKDINYARPLLAKALGIQPRSARVLTLRGTLKELEASLFDPEDAPTLSRRERIRRERGILLYQAQQDYQQALRYDDGYAPAVIRLGRVFHLTDHLKEAREALERGQKMAKDRPTQYVAALFMGALLLDEKDVAGARHSFERAIAIAPTSQPPVVALAHLELMAGRPDRANELARALAKASVGGEPWWVYHQGGLDLAGLWTLRAQVAQ